MKELQRLNLRTRWLIGVLYHSIVLSGLWWVLQWLTPIPLWSPAAQATIYAAGLALYGSLVGFWLAYRLQERLEGAEGALTRLVGGQFSYRMPENGAPEWSSLARLYNQASERMEKQVGALQRLADQNAILAQENKNSAVMEERRRIARELHDTVSQQLFSLQMGAAAFQRGWDKEIAPMLHTSEELQPSRLQQYAMTVKDLADVSASAQAEIRQLLNELRPKEIAESSVIEVMREHYSLLREQQGWTGVFEAKPVEEPPHGVGYHLQRIFGEALHNIVKHAQAKRVSCYIEPLSGGFQLRIVDDGVGFEPQVDSTQPGSYGMQTMQERATEIGARLEILSKPGLGTQVTVKLPQVMGRGRDGA